ncbi:PAS domain S-box protein [Devosia sp. ZB163]|uniref:hybrid sensor histidine kinase/response regulator n=1 Tax=Devosia sp. ZB163 TaxID=3025938 RepID=UPI00235DF924|nr:ATP-binding protein [Devosia sp. ZB163]MDC9822646.1 PAS domain S-box protein [Devosia sp. ZB163]
MTQRFVDHALRVSKAQLLSILSLSGAIGVFDLEGRLLLRNGRLAHVWGDRMPAFTPESEHRWRGNDRAGGILAPADYPEARALRGETVTPGVDFRYTDKAGVYSWLRVCAAPYRDERGGISGAVATLEDVSGERRASDGLREGEARLKAVADLVQLGICRWTLQTDDMEWNAVARAIWGLPSHPGGDYALWRAAIHPDDLGAVDAAIRSSLDPNTREVFDIEYRVIGYDAIERWVAARGAASFAGGKAVALYSAVIDITERKHIEEALAQSVDARSRELELLNGKLREEVAQHAATEAAALQFRAIGQMTSGIAHDFNNLVAIVLANVQLLQRSIHDPEDRDGLELIRVAADRGARIAAQLAAFARKEQLEPQVVDLNAQIIGMSDLLRAALGAGIHLEMALAPNLKAALVDPTQVEMILLNLANNARHAMLGEGTFTVRTLNIVAASATREEHPPAGEYAALLVEDTGEGISNDVLPHVFEPFFTTRTNGLGSGLGLAHISGVLQQSGGGMRIETKVGMGTSVTVYLPVAKAAGKFRPQ